MSLNYQALSDGYEVLEVLKLHRYPQRSVYDHATKSGGIFAEFILAMRRKRWS